VFGWTFYAVLLGFLGAAVYTDLSRFVIPKTITLPMLAVGLVFGVVRGAWMGSLLSQPGNEGHVVGFFATSAGWGALDGLLYALAGLACGFALFFPLWFINVTGGGDVKLVAALGAWLGPSMIFLVIFGSMVLFLVLALFRIVKRVSRRGVQRTVYGFKQGAGATRRPTAARRDQVVAKALPIALATAILLPCLRHADLHLLPPKAEVQASAK
jgi:Flp pilus assembly protein protease CpaA